MATPQEPLKVTYKTFVDDLEAELISSADLYSYGNVDFTYKTQDGVFRSVDIPHEASENDLLIHSLASKSVAYISHDSSYPDNSENVMGAGLWYGAIFYLIPILLIGIIFYQARVIASLGNKLADVRGSNKKEFAEPQR